MTATRSRDLGYRSRRLRNYLVELWSRREFAVYLAAGNLKARNASTALGLFWWVLNPLLLGLVYFLVFGVIFAGDSRPDDYVAYLLSGMFVFHFTHQSMTGGANSILQNAKLLANLKFPRMVLLVSAVIESGVGFLTSIAVFYLIAGLSNEVWPQLSFLWILILLPLQILMNLGLAAVVARLAVPFRDITNFLPYLNRLWLYMSPIIWPLTLLDRVGDPFATLVRLNPMFHLIGVYRSALMGYQLEPESLLIVAVWAVGLFAIGSASFVTYENRMVRYL